MTPCRWHFCERACKTKPGVVDSSSNCALERLTVREKQGQVMKSTEMVIPVAECRGPGGVVRGPADIHIGRERRQDPYTGLSPHSRKYERLCEGRSADSHLNREAGH